MPEDDRAMSKEQAAKYQHHLQMLSQSHVEDAYREGFCDWVFTDGKLPGPLSVQRFLHLESFMELAQTLAWRAPAVDVYFLIRAALPVEQNRPANSISLAHTCFENWRFYVGFRCGRNDYCNCGDCLVDSQGVSALIQSRKLKTMMLPAPIAKQV
jgi:hypothetical protein